MTARLSAVGRSSGRTAATGAGRTDGVPVAGHLLAVAVPARQTVPRRPAGQRERDQRRDPVADGQAERGLGTDLLTVPTSMPPEPVSGLHLAAGPDDLEDLGADGVAVDLPPTFPCQRCACARAGGTTRRQVEPFDPDPDLVGPQLAAGVEAIGRLRQRTATDAIVGDRCRPVGSLGAAMDRPSDKRRGLPEILRRRIRQAG